MADNWGRERAEPVAVGPPRRRMTRADRIREARGQRKRRMAGGFALAMLIVVVVGAVFLGSKLWHTLFGTRQRLSPATASTMWSSRSTTAIPPRRSARRCRNTRWSRRSRRSSRRPTATPRSRRFSRASTRCAPRFRRRMPLPALLIRQNRVGKLVIPEGRQLDDLQDVKTNAVTDGIFSLISKATCVDLDGERHCVSADDLKKIGDHRRTVGAFGARLGDRTRSPRWATTTAGWRG